MLKFIDHKNGTGYVWVWKNDFCVGCINKVPVEYTLGYKIEYEIRMMEQLDIPRVFYSKTTLANCKRIFRNKFNKWLLALQEKN